MQKTHRGTIYLVWENREKLGLSEEDCIKLSRSYDLREESDYGIFREISEDLAETVLVDASDFVNKAKTILQ